MDQKLDYSTLSILIGVLSVAWLFAPRPFDLAKHYDVGAWIAMLSILLAIAGFRQGRHRRALLGLSIGLLSFCAHLLIVPI